MSWAQPQKQHEKSQEQIWLLSALEPRDTSLYVGTTCKWCRSLATVIQMAARIFMSFYLWSTYMALPGWLLLAYPFLGFPTDSLSGSFHHILPPTSLATRLSFPSPHYPHRAWAMCRMHLPRRNHALQPSLPTSQKPTESKASEERSQASRKQY